MSGDRVVDGLFFAALVGLFVALLSGCASRKQIDPMPMRPGDGLTSQVLEAWADARELILEEGVATLEELDRVDPRRYQFHRVDVVFVCRPELARKVRGCFDPRWNLVRYVDGSYSTIVHECIHAIFWGLGLHDVDHSLLEYP